MKFESKFIGPASIAGAHKLQNLSISTFKFDYHYKFPENLTFFKTLILSETLLILNLTTISPSLEITRNGLISLDLMVPRQTVH